ncbi:hypothetical protein ACX0GZ_03695 [Sphingomonas aestuarii]
MVRPVGESVSTDVTPTGQHRFALLFQKSWKSPKMLGFEGLVFGHRNDGRPNHLARPASPDALTITPKHAENPAIPGDPALESIASNQRR